MINSTGHKKTFAKYFLHFGSAINIYFDMLTCQMLLPFTEGELIGSLEISISDTLCLHQTFINLVKNKLK